MLENRFDELGKIDAISLQICALFFLGTNGEFRYSHFHTFRAL